MEEPDKTFVRKYQSLAHQHHNQWTQTEQWDWFTCVGCSRLSKIKNFGNISLETILHGFVFRNSDQKQNKIGHSSRSSSNQRSKETADQTKRKNEKKKRRPKRKNKKKMREKKKNKKNMEKIRNKEKCKKIRKKEKIRKQEK